MFCAYRMVEATSPARAYVTIEKLCRVPLYSGWVNPSRARYFGSISGCCSLLSRTMFFCRLRNCSCVCDIMFLIESFCWPAGPNSINSTLVVITPIRIRRKCFVRMAGLLNLLLLVLRLSFYYSARWSIPGGFNSISSSTVPGLRSSPES
uniref:(northern house mosquito) hypothetical protein n=1 Tax=Culex pipiens TaxID=7175 RepID=A0A8D8N6R8_CULPI